MKIASHSLFQVTKTEPKKIVENLSGSDLPESRSRLEVDKRGPLVTRNITEAEVMEQVQKSYFEFVILF